MSGDFFEDYLKRIKVKTKINKDLESLNLIQRQNLFNIPFENMDIHLKKRISLRVEDLWNKLIKEKRGGICYEINGLLHELLKYIGFDCEFIGASVLDDGCEYDHVLLLVNINSEKWLVDAGFGNNFLEPLKFIQDIEQRDVKGVFKIIKLDCNKYDLLKLNSENEFQRQYTFSIERRKLNDFSQRCGYFETNENSRFKKNKICTLEKVEGRIAMNGNKLRISCGKRIEEIEINNDIEMKKYLELYFGVIIGG